MVKMRVRNGKLQAYEMNIEHPYIDDGIFTLARKMTSFRQSKNVIAL